MFLKCILLSLFISLCSTSTTVRKGGGIGKTTSFQCSNGGNSWTISNNNGGSEYRTNIQERGDILDITSIVAQHEGSYTCNGVASQLIVLAVVQFQGGHCSPYQDCDLGVTSTLPEGQPIPLNISIDFVNGGPRGDKQSIQFIRFKKRESVDSVLLTCGSSGCSIPQNVENVDKRSDSNVNNIQANVTDDRPINASRVFVVELDIVSEANFYETRTATFTVNVTSTSTVLPTSSSLIDDTKSSSSAVLITSTVIPDPPLSSTAAIQTPSPYPATSSSTSESDSTSSPSITEPETSSSSFSLSSSPPSPSTSPSSSSSSSPVLTNPPVPTPITESSEDHILLASILSAFVVTIIVIVLLLAVPFLILYNSKRSTSVSSTIDNSQDTPPRPPEVVIEHTSTTTSSTAIYAEIRTVKDEMHSHNVIRNLHYVSTGSNGSSSSSITDEQPYVDPPYDVPPVVKELVPDFNSVWQPI